MNNKIMKFNTIIQNEVQTLTQNKSLKIIDDFKKIVLKNIEDVFNCKHLIFFELNKDFLYTSPVCIGMSEFGIESLINSKHFLTGPFQFENINTSLKTNKVISYQDLDSYENSYQSLLLKSYNLKSPYFILLKKNELPIGSIVILFDILEEDLSNITLKDMADINDIISNAFSIVNNFDLSNKKLYFYETLFRNDRYGKIIFYPKKNKVFTNNVALTYFLELYDEKDINISNIFEGEFPLNLELFTSEIMDFVLKTYGNYDDVSLYVGNILFNISRKNFYNSDEYFVISMTKDDHRIHLNKIDTIMKKHNISETELNIIRSIIEGMSNEAISKRCFISINTVKVHISNIFKKLNIDNRSQVAYLILKELKICI